MKRSFLTVSHIAFWVVLVSLTALFVGVLSQLSSGNDSEVDYFVKVVLSIFVVPAVFSFYAFYTIVFQRYLQNRKISKTAIYGLGVALTSCVLGHLALYFSIDFNIACLKQSNFISIPIVTSIGLFFGSIALIIKGFITWFKEIKLKEELLEKNHKTEMALVKSQLDPHFLFNTINNIDVLILKNPEEASNYLNKLSDIMRFMLFDTKTNKIPLQKELLYIEKYIELQKIRTANTRYVVYRVDGNPLGKYIAPMVFIPFIENAFKYADNKKIENAITIEITIEEEYVTLKCYNKFSPFKKKRTDSHGLGNELIEKRLKLIYPQQHILNISQENSEYKVKLSIKNEKEQLHHY